jgi:chromosome segregation ATPase
MLAMDETAFQKKLGELMGEISTLPKHERDKLTALASETQERHQKLKKTVHDLQESLDYLRLSIKYLVFDLEATRRENAYLRKMLEQDRTGGGNGGDYETPESDNA